MSLDPSRTAALEQGHRHMDGGPPRGLDAGYGRTLQYLTIAWNSAECAVALAAGFIAGSIALVGFGFVFAIEVTSSLAALWRLRWDADQVRREAAERFTLRLIGTCFLLLAVYVAYDATQTLRQRHASEQSTVGIVAGVSASRRRQRRRPEAGSRRSEEHTSELQSR